ncbi:MAG: cation:proton antiporter [Thermoplasmatota archaeon]
MDALELGPLLLALATIVALCAAARWAFRRIGAPGIVGEMVAGILLGPSLLGWAAPASHAALFPPANAAVLDALSWLGLVLFLFLVGAEMRWSAPRLQAATAVGAGGLLIPMAAGLALGAAYPAWFFPRGPTPHGILLVGAALTVSALPVLARLLEEMGLLETPVGVVAMGAATLQDVAGWVLLAVVAGTGSAWQGFAAMALLAAVIAVGLPLLARDAGPRADRAFIPVVVIVLLAAWATQTAGLNAVLGPLAVGAAVSRRPALRAPLEARLAGVTRALLLPIFFAVSGQEVDLRELLMTGGLPTVLAVAAVATTAKILGCYLGALAVRLPRRTSAALGMLLNARGAVGLVVAKVAFDSGILSRRGYSLLVVVVVLTTLVAPFAARPFLRDRRPSLAGPQAT